MNKLYRYGLALGALGLVLTGLAGYQMHRALAEAQQAKLDAERAKVSADQKRDGATQAAEALQARLDRSKEILRRVTRKGDGQAPAGADLDAVARACGLSVDDCARKADEICEGYRATLAVAATPERPHPEPEKFPMCKEGRTPRSWCISQTLPMATIVRASQASLAAVLYGDVGGATRDKPDTTLSNLISLESGAVTECERLSGVIAVARAALPADAR